MTVETKLALSAEEVRSFSQSNAEPAAFADFRVAALEKAATLEYPKPDRTNITKWNFIDSPAPSSFAKSSSSILFPMVPESVFFASSRYL